ncbi:MAG: membrane protein insertase YidC [Chitinispirillaceae bacterium]|nr:membrane protein insertase YidC [Chitinispirillaceae bacterium]
MLFFVLPITGADTCEIIRNNLSIRTPLMEVDFTPDGDILSIKTRFENVNRTVNREDFSNAGASPLLKVTVPQAASTGAHDEGDGLYRRSENDSAITVRFRSGPVEKSYALRKNAYRIDAAIAISRNTRTPAPHSVDSVEFVLRSESLYDDGYRPFAIDKRSGKVGDYRKTKASRGAEHAWHGVRNRFWVIMVKPPAASASVAYHDTALHFSASLSDERTLKITLYAGPVVYRELKKAGHECTKLLYPLWFWMRWLSFGLQSIFDLLLRIIGNTVISVVALSVCVKILIAPLFHIAHKWQQQVNAQKSLLQPRLDEINKKYKGEEHNQRTLAVYKELGIHPLYSLKSLGSAALQIPVFFAAYHMLSEHIALQGVSFVWINDLSLPDRFLHLPFSIPYAGHYLNLLPFIMTAITVASSWIHTDCTLTPSLLKKQRQSLYLMAGLFFILLYTSPAGMVLYWTINNALAFFSTLFEFISDKKHGSLTIQRGTPL